MVVGIPSFREALRKLGLGAGAPEDETSAIPEGESSDAPPEEAVSTPEEAPAGVTPESAAPEHTQELGEDIDSWSESPASADTDMPFPDDEATKTASPKGLVESWGGAYRNFMAGGESKTEAPSAGGASPSDSRPESGALEIPVEDLSIGIFNALSDGIGTVVKTTSSGGSLVATEARLRVKAIRSESASEFGALRMFITELVCGTKDERRNDG